MEGKEEQMAGEPRKLCTKKKGSGEPCRATALPDKDWCIFHDPERVEQGEEARRRGGESRSRKAATLPDEIAVEKPKTVNDLANLLGDLIVWTLRGTIDVKINNSVTATANTMIGALVKADLEAEVEAMKTDILNLRAQLAAAGAKGAKRAG
jgi:hypothetical protein